MGSQWRRPPTAIDPPSRVDSQQETGNPGRRNPQQKGVGRHCGRSTSLAASLMQTRDKMHKSSKRKTKTDQTPNRNTDRPKTPTPRRTKEQKTGQGGDLGVDVERGERVEVRECGRDEENTRGPKPPRGVWVSPPRSA